MLPLFGIDRLMTAFIDGNSEFDGIQICRPIEASSIQPRPSAVRGRKIT
jgi:hypothetical protein